MADNKMEKSIKEAIGKSLNEFNKRIGMAKLIKDNKNQDRILKGILSQVNDENIEKTEKSNVITLDNSTDGIVELQEIKGDTNVNVSKIEKETPITHVIDDKNGNVVSLDGITEGAISIDNIQGNTMVNCNKDTDKELILMPNLDTSGYSNITLTEGIDGGKVDVSLEGNTMVNVCEQEDSIAITKSYTVDTGNHIALQGEYDGKCRPNIYGNTLVNLCEYYQNIQCVVNNNSYNMQPSENSVSRIDFKCNGIQVGKQYTIVFTTSGLSNSQYIRVGIMDIPKYVWVGNNYDISTNGLNKKLLTVSESSNNFGLRFHTSDEDKSTACIVSNVVLLEGDYTNKPIPDYFTGMKSSFEDKLVPENLLTASNNTEHVTTTDTEYILGVDEGEYSILNISTNKTLEQGKTYTVYFNTINKIGTPNVACALYNNDINLGDYGNCSEAKTLNNNLIVLNCTSECKKLRIVQKVSKGNSISLSKKIYLVEGDYTNYDFTNYNPTKAGKYKVDYKVTGKNKCSIIDGNYSNNSNGLTWTIKNNQVQINGTSTGISSLGTYVCHPNFINGKTYVTSTSNSNVILYISYIDNGTRKYSGGGQKTYTHNSNYTDIMCYLQVNNSDITFNNEIINCQIEEGTTATTYEPYKEYTKTLYLNSPLLKGDTIEQSGNNIIHNHRYGKVVLDGSNYVPTSEKTLSSVGNYRWRFFKSDVKNSVSTTGLGICDKYPIVSPTDTWNSIEGITQNNDGNKIVLYLDKYKDGSDASKQALINELSTSPITFVYELTTPTQEIISPNDNLLLDSYTNGHLDVDSVVPIDKAVFKGNFGKDLKYLYSNTEYTIQLESDNVGKIDNLYCSGQGTTLLNLNVIKGINKFSLTTLDNPNPYIDITGIGFNASKIVVTPKVDNNFGYFKGMKSVGECEDNKIEILSNNINLFNGEWELGGFKTNGSPSTDTNQFRCVNPIKVEPNTRYSHSSRKVIHYLDKDLNQITYDVSGALIFDTPSNCHYINIRTFNADFVSDFKNFKYMLVKGENMPTTHIDGLSNKKEILLNEPLRGLPNGVKDKYVIIDGKWYIERNCGKIVLNGNETDWESIYAFEKTNVFRKPLIDAKNTINNDYEIVPDNFIVDKLPIVKYSTYNILNAQTISFSSLYNKNVYNGTAIYINMNSSNNLKSFKQWLSTNPIDVIYELAQPTYEPIDYNPFEVYTDTTHISNNSTIPCNMVIKNSGFNCILKPNTKYTVSSNNGLSTVSTKDSIGDSILRFYNKDTSSITKMNNVLVLEGDYITGNPPIPAFFKGMESAFEQELVTDEKDEHYGKYKVNVKAIGKNLISSVIPNKYQNFNVVNGNFTVSSNNNCSVTDFIRVIPGKTYIGTNLDGGGAYYDYNKKPILPMRADLSKPFIIPNGAYYFRANLWKNPTGQGNIQLEQGTKATEYEPYKENNITFYLNEPLRGVGNVKDKVYVKENKVVVERNCSSATFDGSDDEEYAIWENNSKKPTQECFILTKSISHMPNIAIGSNGYSGLNYISNNFIRGEVSQIGFVMQYYVNMHFGLPKATLKTDNIDGFRQYLQNNPTTVVYQLATPVYEEVEYSNNRLTLNTYNNSTLFYNSNIPISNTSFKPLWEELIYIKNSTTYYIQFNAVGNGNVVVNLGGTELTTTITEGYNKIEIITPNNSTNLLTIDGQGIKISKVVVSEALCSGYYKGLQSCFEEHMENGKYVCVIRGISLDGNKVNGIKFYLNEPLRGIGDIKDRLCIKDNKLMVERKYESLILDNTQEYGILDNMALDNTIIFRRNKAINAKNYANHISDKMLSSISGLSNVDTEGTYIFGNTIRIRVSRNKLSTQDLIGFNSWIASNPIKIIFELIETVYEEVTNEYGLPIILEGYENGIVYVDSAVTPTTSIKYTSNNKVPGTLSNVDNLNTATQNDINNNIVTYMMDIDMMLTEMEMDDSASTMSLSDLDDNNQNHDSSHSNILDRMNKEDRIKYQDNTTKMLEKVIKGKSLTKEENINRIDLYLSEGKIREEQSNYLKELLKGVE